MTQKSALEFAHAFEVKGVNLYMKLASKTGNVLAKEVLYSLATQEVDHARRIDELGRSLKGDKGLSPMSSIRAGSIENEVKKFFSAAGKARLKKNAEELQGYEMAMKMELKGYHAYREFSQDSTTAAERDFFKQLMTEENKHYEALSNVYAYLTGKEDWLQVEESRTWNWMNT